MSFDETTSKPFKNVSIKSILNEEDQRERNQSIKQESLSSSNYQSPISSPNNSTNPRGSNTISDSKSFSESPISYSHVLSGPNSGMTNLESGTGVNSNNPNFPHNYTQNVPYNIRVPYYPIQSTADYGENRRGRRFRRRYNQIIRKYMCSFPGCSKSYGSLNHLNTHIVSKKHGQRKSKADFQSQEDSNSNNLIPNMPGWYGPPTPHPSAGYIHLPQLQHPHDPRIQVQQQAPPPPPAPAPPPHIGPPSSQTPISSQISHSQHGHPISQSYYMHQPVNWVVPPNYSTLPNHPPPIQHQQHQFQRQQHQQPPLPPHESQQPPQHLPQPQSTPLPPSGSHLTSGLQHPSLVSHQHQNQHLMLLQQQQQQQHHHPLNNQIPPIRHSQTSASLSQYSTQTQQAEPLTSSSSEVSAKSFTSKSE